MASVPSFSIRRAALFSFPDALLVNAYPQGGKGEEKISAFRDLLSALTARLGLSWKWRVVNENGFSEPAAAVVLSGSPRLIGRGEYSGPLLAWLFRCRIPFLGVCYGHQLLALSFGGTVSSASGDGCHGPEEIHLRRMDAIFSRFPSCFKMVESHREAVVFNGRLSRNFLLLAVNGRGGVEAIRHRRRPLWGVQFHPERSGATGEALIGNFLRAAWRQTSHE